MNLRNKLALSFTTVFIFLLGITFTSIYFISKKNRHTEFRQRFKERTLNSFRLFIEMKFANDNILEKLDKNLINNLRQNTFLFDSSANLIYNSTINLKPDYCDEVLKKLMHKDDEVFLPIGSNELLGIKFIERGKRYYGIALAEDKVGKETMNFLDLLLLTCFTLSVIILVLLSFYLSSLITYPITRLTKEIEDISPDNLSHRVFQDKGKDEVIFLASKFNEMLDKVENAFKFQHQFINHLSHELKTPLAIMMANLERAFIDDDNEKLKSSMHFQKNAIMELSNIMNIMLDISRMENKLTATHFESIRIDEIIFECVDELTILNANTRFDFNIHNALDEVTLTISGNSRMVKLAVMNLIKNAVSFSSKENPALEISVLKNKVILKVYNDGALLEKDEQLLLFKTSFRGKNSLSVKGFGLGLVLTHRIVKIHNGDLEYSVYESKRNCFTLSLPIEYK
jgi:two-component system sensor histidine kinase ArlS